MPRKPRTIYDQMMAEQKYEEALRQAAIGAAEADIHDIDNCAFCQALIHGGTPTVVLNNTLDGIESIGIAP